MFPYTISQDSITVLIEGVPKVVDKSHANYNLIYKAIKQEKWSKIPKLISVTKAIEEYAKGTIKILEGVLFYMDKPLDNYIVTKILKLMKEGFNVSTLINFLENLMQNPSYRAVQELYEFLEKGNVPITEDGHFIVYKKVRKNYTDIYSGTFDNSVGKIIRMPRNQVNEDSSQTCSAGLHVCSFDYLRHFGSCSDNRVVACKVNPKNVVSIPTDYNNTKMRVCEYEVISDVTLSYTNKEDILSKSPVYKEQKKHKKSSKRKPVACFKNGKKHCTYSSAKEAEDITGIFATNITQVCRGGRKSAGGLKWKYL